MTLTDQLATLPARLEELLAFHHSTFGDARMEATDDEPDDAEGGDKPTDEQSEDDANAADKDQEEKDWKAEFEAQKRINRNLERKSKRTFDDFQKLQAETKKSGSDDKPDLDKIRADAETAAAAKVNERIIRSEIRAAAAGKMQDPKDALAHLDLSQFEVDADGNVDEAEIADAIGELLEKKPYLGVTQGDKKKFQGGADGGSRGKASKSQLTEADVKKLAADGKHAEIEQARVDGRLNELLGIK